MPTITRVRKDPASNGTHRHIVGVCSTANVFYTNRQVVDSINSGEFWQTQASDGSYARIKPLMYCPATSCLHKPYITTSPDDSTANNLENLPSC